MTDPKKPQFIRDPLDPSQLKNIDSEESNELHGGDPTAVPPEMMDLADENTDNEPEENKTEDLSEGDQSFSIDETPEEEV